MRCDVIAQGVIAAAEELSLRIPIVVRLQVRTPPLEDLIEILVSMVVERN